MRHASSLTHVITPHVLLPAQVESHTLPPEVRLLIAVLQDGILCAQTAGRKVRGHKGLTDKPVQVAAIEWMRSKRRDYLCAYERICELLNLDPDAVRGAVLSGLK